MSKSVISHRALCRALTAISPASRTQILSYEMMVRRRSWTSGSQSSRVIHALETPRIEQESLTSNAEDRSITEFVCDCFLDLVVSLVVNRSCGICRVKESNFSIHGRCIRGKNRTGGLVKDENFGILDQRSSKGNQGSLEITVE